MIGFHIDMNIAQFQRGYLEKWLAEFSAGGFDTIVWEIENNVRWETCPECSSPDAFSQEEFRHILTRSRSLGLEPIPLLQTLAHCEYVLKHQRYAPLAEVEGAIDQYCPCHEDLVPFLHRWIEEYLEMFGEVNYFHIGADEAWSLGKCERCREFVARHSLSELYLRHVEAVCEPLRARKIKPILWADMMLTHRQSLEDLSHEVVLFDWMYDIHRGNGKVWVWEAGKKGLYGKDDIDPDYRQAFEPYLFPAAAPAAGEPETFYTADYLADKGFEVVTCPGSSSYGDNVFSPRHRLHLANTFDSFQKGMRPPLRGSVLTSWTVHLFPWELQRSCIDLPMFIRQHPDKTLQDFAGYFAQKHFGRSDSAFFDACDLLSDQCLFTHTQSLGFSKSAPEVPLDHALQTIDQIRRAGTLDREIAQCEKCIEDYQEALALLTDFHRRVNAGHELLECWLLAARNLLHRAEASRFLLAAAQNADGSGPEGKALLEAMLSLQNETATAYAKMIKPARQKEIISWMFDAVAHALTHWVSRS